MVARAHIVDEDTPSLRVCESATIEEPAMPYPSSVEASITTGRDTTQVPGVAAPGSAKARMFQTSEHTITTNIDEFA